MDPILAEAIAWRIATWMSTAAQHCRNEEFYRGLLDKCAAELGPVRPKVFVQDDGGIVIDPLRVKIPELVAELADMADKHLKSERQPQPIDLTSPVPQIVHGTFKYNPAPAPNFEVARRAGELYARLESELGRGHLDMRMKKVGIRTDSPKMLVYQWNVRTDAGITSAQFAVDNRMLMNETIDFLTDVIANELKSVIRGL